MTETIAIVGASLAGANAAQMLRREGFDGRVVLIGAEPQLPYDRPPLSKELLLGEIEPAKIALFPETAYAEASIEVLTNTRVTRLRPTERLLELDNGSTLQADRVLLCTGARPRPLAIPGLNLPGVYELRTLDDALRLREALAPGARVVVIGFGFIGAEVAAAANQRGCQVTLVEVAPLPMQRVVGQELGKLFVALHQEHGVDVRLGVVVEAIHGDGHCQAVALADGTTLPADVVVCGVGVLPNVELAEAAGITVANGIVVDARCRTSLPEVFACGDVATRPSSYAGGHIRLESWQNAQNQGIAAARALLGSTAEFDDLPWFWSDQYDVRMQMAGLPDATDEVVWRGSPDGYNCTIFYLRDGTVRAAIGLSRPRDVRAAMDLIRKRTRVEPATLRDESTNLRDLSAGA